MTDTQTTDQRIEQELTRRAQSRRPRVKRWYGVRGGGTQKHYECYICDAWVDTWAAKWAIPRHAEQALAEHRHSHEAEL